MENLSKAQLEHLLQFGKWTREKKAIYLSNNAVYNLGKNQCISIQTLAIMESITTSIFTFYNAL